MSLPGPLKRQQAEKRWPRDAIKEYTFPQRPRPERHVLPRPEHTDRPKATAPNLPAAGDIRVTPEFAIPPRALRSRSGSRIEPLIVYPPDGRHVFQDTAYPWRCCGRVTTSAGAQGAGALVGPRHLLTASHVMPWLTNGDVGSVLFQPDYYDGNVFPESHIISVYQYEQISANDIGEYACAEDYVCCILADRLGDELSWFGTLSWDDDWDGTAYWNHVGYPEDVGGGTKPAWELWFSVLNSWNPGFFESGNGWDLVTHASMNHGDSGGPLFGWWSQDPLPGAGVGPFIVGVASGEGSLSPIWDDYSSDRTGNWFGAGVEIPNMVNTARSDYP